MSLSFKFDARAVEKAIAKKRKRTTNSKKVLDQIADQEIKDARRRIRTTKVTPEGLPWAPWSYATIRQRLREGNIARGLLYKSGMLYRSFKKKVTNKKFEITNTADYSRYLQSGTNKMPARPFLGFSHNSVRRIAKLFNKQLGD